MKSTVIEEIKRYGEDETKIVLSRVPPQFLNNDMLKVIDTYAKLIRINNILDQYGIQIGSKHVFVKKEDMRHIPRFLLMGAVQVHVRYEEQRSVVIAKRVVMKDTNVNTSMMSENSGKEKKPNRTLKDQLPMRTIDLHHTSLPQTQVSSLIQNTHNSPSKTKEHKKKFLRLSISPNAVKLN